jgi:ligand-binding sensor domain-containing protein
LEILTPDGKFYQLQRGNFISVRPILPFGTRFEFPQNVIRDSEGVFWAATQKGLFNPNYATGFMYWIGSALADGRLKKHSALAKQ